MLFQVFFSSDNVAPYAKYLKLAHSSLASSPKEPSVPGKASHFQIGNYKINTAGCNISAFIGCIMIIAFSSLDSQKKVTYTKSCS